MAHASWSHLLWDLLPFVLLGALAEPCGRGRFAALLGAAALLPGLAWAAFGHAPLAGASGWDSALFVAVSLDLIARHGAARPARLLGSVALLLFAAKVALELNLGHALFLGAEGAGAAPVHLLAALVGAGVWSLFRKVPGRCGNVPP